MMNWNSNDTKYIIKRIILYFIIAGIVFFAGQSCAKAQVLSRYVCDVGGVSCGSTFNIGEYYTTGAISTAYGNHLFASGEGYIIFTFTTWENANSNTWPLKSVEVRNYINGGGYNVFGCEIGSVGGWNDNANQWNVFTAKCPVQFNDNGLYDIRFERMNDTNYKYIQRSSLITFVSDTSEASAIINANNNAISQQIAAGNANAQAIQNAISSSTAQEITAINNQTTAINNQTTAINNQTEWFEEQHDPLIDTGFLDVMGDLITTNDSNVVRQFIMIPFNLFVQIYNACTSNTCSPLTLGTLYGTTLTLPCINWTTLVGSAIANTIDIIFSACLIFGMYRMIKHMINKIFTLSGTITDECGVEVFN